MKISGTFNNITLMLIACLLVILKPDIQAQGIHKNRFAVVDVIVEDSVLLRGTSITFDINTNSINTPHPGFTKSYNKAINSRVTRMIIPLSEAINYGRISFNDDGIINGKLQDRPLDYSNNLFLFENGDTIVLHLSERKGGALFTGKCADKYNCMYRVNSNGSTNEIKSFSKVAADIALKKYKAALNYQKFQLDSLYKKQLTILEDYKGGLNPKVYQLIHIDCWGVYNKLVADLYLNVFARKYSEQYQAAKDLFIGDYGNYKEILFKDSALLVKSYEYGEFLTTKEKAFAVIMNSTADQSYYNNTKFSDINKAIDLHYEKGIVKDKVKLLSFLNIDRRREADFVDFLNEAIVDAGNNQFRTALTAFNDANATGVNAFSFELPDKNGKVIRLVDFKGKTVIIDFWFTGCHACLFMAKALKPIAAQYKANAQIVFVTVSIDPNYELWQKSLATERYCSKDEVNLLADSGMRSAIITHYNIEAFPTLIAISKSGKIISTAPPDPRVDGAVFTDFLNKVLIIGK